MDRDAFDDLDLRDEAAQGPLDVERLAPAGRRRRLGWQAPAVLFVAIALAAGVGRAQTWHETSSPVPPALPTPIPWVDAIVPQESVTPSPAVAPSVSAEAITDSIFWTVGKPNHFTVRVTNTTSQPIPLSPCPTYRMYVVGTPANLATIRAMNCADMGYDFTPGETILLDMAYTPSATDPLGFQTIEWEAISGFQATAQMASIDIEA
jgi:hypothetical protein